MTSVIRKAVFPAAGLGTRFLPATKAQPKELLPLVDLDPCSNPRSTVRARMTMSLEAGQDGLAAPWVGSVFVNTTGPGLNFSFVQERIQPIQLRDRVG